MGVAVTPDSVGVSKPRTPEQRATRARLVHPRRAARRRSPRVDRRFPGFPRIMHPQTGPVGPTPSAWARWQTAPRHQATASDSPIVIAETRIKIPYVTRYPR
jgi:hypothetical protein